MRSHRFITAAILTLAIGTGGAHAQSAWQKIAQKLSPNSLEKQPEVVPEDTSENPVNSTPNEVPNEPGSAVANVPGRVVGPDAGGTSPDPGTIGLPMMSDEKGKKGKSTINLGKESEEAESFMDLFNKPEVLAMLGVSPRFVYKPNDRPDPMIFPPVRNAAIFMELTKEADKLIAEKKLAEALKVYQKILQLKDRRYVADARSKIAAIEGELGTVATAALEASKPEVVELPDWVRDNTRGILLAQSQPMALVGDFLLKQGDTVPAYPEVHIGVITKEKVSYTVSNQTFEVPVKGYEDGDISSKPGASRNKPRSAAPRRSSSPAPSAPRANQGNPEGARPPQARPAMPTRNNY